MGDSNERERGDKALQPYLEKDEKIQTWAYGTQRSPLLILAGMASWVAACLPAALWFIVAGVSVFSFLMGFFIFWIGVFFLGHECEKRLRKDFLVAVTARRLLIVRIKNPMFFTPDLFDQIAHRDYSLNAMPPTDCEKGRLRIADTARPPFEAKFPAKAVRKDNRMAFSEIVRVLESSRSRAATTAASD